MFHALVFVVVFSEHSEPDSSTARRGQRKMSGAKSGVTHVSELALAPKLYRLKKAFG